MEEAFAPKRHAGRIGTKRRGLGTRRRETRVALARDYYNAIATHLNTRLEIVPDRWFAPLAGLRAQSLLVAESFERTPVAVRLA